MARAGVGTNDDAFARAIDAIYETSLQPETWPAALDALGKALSNGGAAMVDLWPQPLDPRIPVPSAATTVYSHNFPREAVAAQVGGLDSNSWRLSQRMIARTPLHVPMRPEIAFPDGEAGLQRSELHRIVFHPHGLRYMLGG